MNFSTALQRYTRYACHTRYTRYTERSKTGGSTQAMIELHLPYPPSLGHYYRTVRGRILISRDGREYRLAVQRMVAAAGSPRAHGALDVSLHVNPPSLVRVQDIDNSLKALFDALQHAGVYANDRQICHLEVLRGRLLPGGLVRVRLSSWNGEGSEYVRSNP